MATIDEIFAAIVREREYQNRKYGSPEERKLLLTEYLQIAQQELNEAMCAVADGDYDNALCEALQAASVLVAAFEQHGAIERPLNQLQEGTYDDNDDAHCNVCEEDGACRDWVECMADDAGVPVDWLAQQVLDDQISWYFAVIQVQAAYAEVSNA